ncbi:hypothetical protein PtA15_7A377 [Puccinia triticina]|uniref:C3H1-type domain-containing protein n=1 Tax=Puccinia triticina TaxID=208348 RepID=A0ABY7CNP0_9BASI|nr:uncharacterized protein PtA15_7A377 [Puccinia triticina]WAQ86650.1 hypothetical protein PtA15_7A377 [Puccinia triticina]
MPNYMFQLQSAVLSNPPPPPASNSDTLDNAALLFAGSVFNSQTHKLTTSSPTLQFKSLKPNPFKSCRRAFCGRFHGSPSASLHHEIPLGQVINWHNIISSTEPPPFNPPLLAEATRHEEHGDANLLGDDFDPLAGYENKDWVIGDLDTRRKSDQTTTITEQDSSNHCHQASSQKPNLTHHVSASCAQETLQPGAATLKHCSHKPRAARQYQTFNSLGRVHILKKEEEKIVKQQICLQENRSGQQAQTN